MHEEPGWTGPAPQDIAAWTLIQASHVVAKRFRGALQEVGVSPTQFGVLVQLASHPGMASAEMARTILVTPQAMTGLLSSLQELRLITRDESAGHGRRVPALLTAEGKQLLQRCAAAVAHVERSLGLTSGQAAELNQLLHIIIAGER